MRNGSIWREWLNRKFGVGDRRIEFVEAAPVDDPIRGQGADVGWGIGRVGSGTGNFAQDAAGEPGEEELEVEGRRSKAAGLREHMVVAVCLANHAVSEPVGCRRELDRHVGHLLESIELPALVQNPGDDALLRQALDEIVQHHPLIVPSHQLSCFREELVGRRRVGPGREHVDDLVVEFQERKVRLCDQQILVIAVVADQGPPFRIPRQIIRKDAGRARRGLCLAEQELRPGL